MTESTRSTRDWSTFTWPRAILIIVAAGVLAAVLFAIEWFTHIFDHTYLGLPIIIWVAPLAAAWRRKRDAKR